MVESTPRTGEAAGGQLLDALLRWRCRLAFVFQGQYQNALEATHIDQVEAERSGTRGIQPLRRVAFTQACSVRLNRSSRCPLFPGLLPAYRPARAGPCSSDMIEHMF